MKPKLDLSNTGKFCIWEIGGWHSTKLTGHASLAAGPEGEKLQAIYTRTVSSNNTRHALFEVAAGDIVTSVNLRRKGDLLLTAHMEVVRINELYTYQIQNPEFPEDPTRTVAAPGCKFTSLWNVSRAVGSRLTPEQTASFLLFDLPEIQGLSNLEELMRLTIQKAMTTNINQHIFWGHDRDNIPQMTSTEALDKRDRLERQGQQNARARRIARGFPEDLYEDDE